MASILDLKRQTYMKLNASTRKPALDYLSAKYKNIRFALPAKISMVIDHSNVANSPGIAHLAYGDKNYWWVICLFNGIIDPIADIESGTTLQLPALADINAFLSSQDQQDLTTSVTI